jgi:hypothetical protein
MSTLFLSGCIETALVYNPNTYQTGRSLGKDNVTLRMAVSAAQEVHSSPGNAGLETDMANQALSVSAGLAVGLNEFTDVGGNLQFGFPGAGSTIGTRIYLKQMMTLRSSKWAFALMPAVSYEHGVNQTDEETRSRISSSLFALEMHAPISYHYRPWLAAVIVPKLLWLHYSAPFSAGIHETNPSLHTTSNDWICPGLGLGAKVGPVFPEASFILVSGKLKTLGGVGVSF